MDHLFVLLKDTSFFTIAWYVCEVYYHTRSFFQFNFGGRFVFSTMHSLFNFYFVVNKTEIHSTKADCARVDDTIPSLVLQSLAMADILFITQKMLSNPLLVGKLNITMVDIILLFIPHRIPLLKMVKICLYLMQKTLLYPEVVVASLWLHKELS